MFRVCLPHCFDFNEIVLRQASVSLKAYRPNAACSSVPIANSLRPRNLGAVHERDLVIGKRDSCIILGHHLMNQQTRHTIANFNEPTVPRHHSAGNHSPCEELV
jgi:hypothetical protein